MHLNHKCYFGTKRQNLLHNNCVIYEIYSDFNFDGHFSVRLYYAKNIIILIAVEDKFAMSILIFVNHWQTYARGSNRSKCLADMLQHKLT